MCPPQILPSDCHNLERFHFQYTKQANPHQMVRSGVSQCGRPDSLGATDFYKEVLAAWKINIGWKIDSVVQSVLSLLSGIGSQAGEGPIANRVISSCSAQRAHFSKLCLPFLNSTFTSPFRFLTLPELSFLWSVDEGRLQSPPLPCHGIGWDSNFENLPCPISIS